MKATVIWLRRHLLDAALWLLFLLSAFLMMKASSDPSPDWLRGTSLQRALAPFPTGNQVVFELSAGVIVSLFIYVLVVRVPEYRRRLRLRASLERQYRWMKEECIMNFLWACGSGANLDLVERLLDRHYFKEYFSEQVSPGQNRWHAVLNGMDDEKLSAIIQALGHFRRELEYTLAVVDVDEPQVFAFLRHLTQTLHRGERWSNDYDELKSMSRFMWSMHTGWDWIKGYEDRDRIAQMIAAI